MQYKQEHYTIIFLDYNIERGYGVVKSKFKRLRYEVGYINQSECILRVIKTVHNRLLFMSL